MECEKEDDACINLDELKEALINHVCLDKKTFFKHQQKDEEDIKEEEKKNIVSEILNDSPSRFLARFGMILKKEHLKFFELQNFDENQNTLLREQLKSLRWNLDHERILVKNRRYAAMVKLINDKEYFSEDEMKKRNPVLFEELIGKHQSLAEKTKRKRPNLQESTLVDVLLDQIDHEKSLENMKIQQELEGEDSKKSFSDEQSDIETDQWGNFEDEKVKISKRNKARKRNATTFVTATERDMLREEFLGIMYNDFLLGNDAEFFDYSLVDSNEEYDEVLENDQDCEDKYFDEDDISENQQSEENRINKSASESEDELDVYMRHIEQHIKRQEKDTFREEFDEDE